MTDRDKQRTNPGKKFISKCDENLLVELTQPSMTPSNSAHFKNEYVFQNSKQTFNYIKSLEKNIAINKEVINELCSQTKTSQQYSKTIEKLNTENQELHTENKSLTKEKEALLAKCLVYEQIIDQSGIKEEEMNKDFNQQLLELKDQLNRKEYLIQEMEKKYYKSLEYLRKFCLNDPELRRQLKELQINCLEGKKISNVVEDNERLTDQIKKYEEKIKTLENRIKQLSANNTSKAGEVKLTKSKSKALKIIKIDLFNQNANIFEDQNESNENNNFEMRSNKKSVNWKNKISNISKKLSEYSENVLRFIDLYLVMNCLIKMKNEEYRPDLIKQDEKRKENLEFEANRLIEKLKTQINDLDLQKEFAFNDSDNDASPFKSMNKKCNDISCINQENENEAETSNNLSNFSDCIEIPGMIEKFCKKKNGDMSNFNNNNIENII